MSLIVGTKRTLLAILYWNENIGRDTYGQAEEGNFKRVLKPPTLCFGEKMWVKLLEKVSVE